MASVRAQTFTDFELLIVDDGSTDSTFELASQLQAHDERIRVLTRPNGGIAAARNTAMREARGRFFALLDSDDLWMPTFLEAHLPLFERFGIDVATNNALNLGGADDGKPLHPKASGYRHITLLDMIAEENAVCISAVFRREVYDAIGGFDEHLSRNEDYQYWIRAAHAGFRFVENARPLALYRRRPDSVSADERLMLAGIMQVLRSARHICRDDEAVCAEIDRQLLRFESEHLLASAKIHLTRGEYSAAAAQLDKLHRVARSPRTYATARLAQYLPRVLWLAYRLKRAVVMRALGQLQLG